jgi:hypothetical protein
MQAQAGNRIAVRPINNPFNLRNDMYRTPRE